MNRTYLFNFLKIQLKSRLIEITRDTIQPRHVLKISHVESIKQCRIHALPQGQIIQDIRRQTTTWLAYRTLICRGGTFGYDSLIRDLEGSNTAPGRPTIALVFA